MTMRVHAFRRALFAGMAGLLLAQPIEAEKPPKQTASASTADDLAADFGAREAISGAKLSPDGRQVLYLAADRGPATELMVASANAQGVPHPALMADGKPMRIQWCDWSDNNRIVCLIYLNVNVAESRLMNDRLRAAGKQSTLVVYPDLDHQLPSGEIRADMLRRADAFLRESMKIGG